MTFYEHTFVSKQDISDKDVDNLANTCAEIINKSGNFWKYNRLAYCSRIKSDC